MRSRWSVLNDELTGFDDYPDSGQNDFGTVVVEDDGVQTLYPEGSECHRCPKESIGVVIVELPHQTEHKPVCKEHLAEAKKTHTEIQFREYE